MVDNIDMSLDDIIKSNKPRRGARRGGRGGPRGGGAPRRGTFRRAGGVQRGRGRGGITGRGQGRSPVQHGPHQTHGGQFRLWSLGLRYSGTLCRVRALEKRLRALRPLREVTRYGRRDFERRSDAIKAMKQYNGVPLDGRAMNIQIITSEIPSPVRRGPTQTKFQNRSPRGATKTRPNRGTFT
ncbi:unnamed protein product [Tenebrio molitor]|nr:unnamed protein product [Tenebrio molitor]